MSNPVALSTAQMAAFEAIYDPNYRPVQPFNARVFYVGGEPSTVPETGGAAFPLEAVLIGFGTLTAAAGVYLQRRKAAYRAL
jgi:hypothetical protein